MLSRKLQGTLSNQNEEINEILIIKTMICNKRKTISKNTYNQNDLAKAQMKYVNLLLWLGQTPTHKGEVYIFSHTHTHTRETK